MKLDQEMLAWVKHHEKLLEDLRVAETLVKYGKIVLFYRDGKYLGMDACPRERIGP